MKAVFKTASKFTNAVLGVGESRKATHHDYIGKDRLCKGVVGWGGLTCSGCTLSRDTGCSCHSSRLCKEMPGGSLSTDFQGFTPTPPTVLSSRLQREDFFFFFFLAMAGGTVKRQRGKPLLVCRKLRVDEQGDTLTFFSRLQLLSQLL